MSAVNEAIEFFKGDLKQTMMTLSVSSKQLGDQMQVGILDGFVVQAAAQGLLVEVYIDDALRPYEFGDYVRLRQQLGIVAVEDAPEDSYLFPGLDEAVTPGNGDEGTPDTDQGLG